MPNKMSMDLTPDPMDLINYCRRAYSERARPYAIRVFQSGWPSIDRQTAETILSCKPDKLDQELVNAGICHYSEELKGGTDEITSMQSR